MNTDCNAPLKNNFTKEIPKESNICLSYDINLSKSLTAVVAFNTKLQASQDVHKCKTKATVKCFLGHSQQLWGNKTYSRLPGVPRGPPSLLHQMGHPTHCRKTETHPGTQAKTLQCDLCLRLSHGTRSSSSTT